MGRVIRNQRKGRGSIFSMLIQPVSRSTCSIDRIIQLHTLDLTKPQRNLGHLTLRNDMVTYGASSKILFTTQAEVPH